MTDSLIAVLDVGKTMAKLSLWTPAGEQVARADRPNRKLRAGGYDALDAAGVEDWLLVTLAKFAALGRIGAVVPVAHGAAAAIVRNDTLVVPPLDYEQQIPDDLRRAYLAERDAFAHTGSPALPHGLNLGAQLHYLAQLHPGLLDGAQILTWPQYWAWRLSGARACEVTSLGCHSDLWRPRERTTSHLARRRGWADRLAPLASAGEVLGVIRPELARRTGLPSDVKVYCGLHDSNAALLAARGFPEIADREATVLSTGTWFVAMRTPAAGAEVDIAALPEGRDCLVNIDALGQLIPSARFMGGREIELLTGPDEPRIDARSAQADLVAAVAKVVATGGRALPTFAPGFGPFPQGEGRWVGLPTVGAEKRAAVALYAALVADASLDLIGARERILVEGRFTEAEVFVRSLASLRPADRIYVSDIHNDVSFGALRLLHPTLRPSTSLVEVKPLNVSLDAYRARWRSEAAGDGQ